MHDQLKSCLIPYLQKELREVGDQLAAANTEKTLSSAQVLQLQQQLNDCVSANNRYSSMQTSLLTITHVY